MGKRENVTSNLIWRFLERFGAHGVTFVVSIILARLLDPKVYGMIALVTVFTTIMQVFVDSGLGMALIQKKDADDLDFSTIFFFNIGMCLILYWAMFFIAPVIANFYEMPDLVWVIRVLSLTIVVSGVKNIQQAYISRNLMFKKFFFATLIGTIGAAIIGISLAYLGFGVWALVVQNLFNVTVDTIILWITVKWRPKLMFSWARWKVLFKYGWKLLVASLIETGYNNLHALIIGKKYSAEDLAYYNKGDQFPRFIVSNINTSINSVLLPTLAQEQENKKRIKEMVRRAIKVATYVMMPMMVGLAVCADPLVRILLTEKWLPAVLFLRIFCISYAFYPIHTANLNAMKAMGKSDIFLRAEIIHRSLGVVVLVSTMFINVEAIAYGALFVSIVSQAVDAWPNKKLFDYGYFEQIKDILPNIIISIIMGVSVFLISLLNIDYYLMLIIQIPIGILIYWGLSKIFKIDSYKYIVEIAKNTLQKIRPKKKKRG